MRRLKTIFEAKASRALDSMEDPREMLDLSYEKQVEMLRDVKRGVVEVTAARRRLQLQADEIRGQLVKFDNQARQALASGREDLARAALERKQEALGRLAGFEAQVQQLQGEQDRLVRAEARLAAKVEAFRTQKEVIKAQYTAAQATVRIGEAVTGLSEEMTDVGMAVQRAEDRTAQLRSRGEAISELLDAGVLSEALGGPASSALDRELELMGTAYSVEVELEAIRRTLGAPGEAGRLAAPAAAMTLGAPSAPALLEEGKQ